MKTKLGALVALVIVAVTVTAIPSSADRIEHCAVHVIGRRPSGELVTTAPECRSSYRSALAAAGAANVSKLQAGATSNDLQAVRTTESFVIGTHYDGASLTGSSFSVVGDNCSGGWLNLTSDWINRVSSTANGCFEVKHWDGYGLTGSSESTFGSGGNLSGLNNKANSIQYL